jgi:glycosyltransferase involved in cell wall biosynthesis
VTKPLVVVDADVLGRRRTGDETYVEQLLRTLPEVADDFRYAALTRRPELVPDEVEPVYVPARLQELRMLWSVPRVLHRMRPAVAHFLHVLPPALPCPAVVKIPDLSWQRDASVMNARDRLIFRALVPRAARRSSRIVTVSERSKRDLVATYGLPTEKIVVTPLGVEPAFTPGANGHDSYLLYVGSIEPRKQPLVAADAARAVGRPLVVAGPTKDEALAAELRRRGADVRGYVSKEELVRLYRQAACVVLPSKHEGFGLPVVEAMACGTPVVAATDEAMREVAGDAAVFGSDVPAGVRRALAERERLSAAGIERAKAFTWEETARRTAAAYREALG